MIAKIAQLFHRYFWLLVVVCTHILLALSSERQFALLTVVAASAGLTISLVPVAPTSRFSSVVFNGMDAGAHYICIWSLLTGIMYLLASQTVGEAILSIMLFVGVALAVEIVWWSTCSILFFSGTDER